MTTRHPLEQLARQLDLRTSLPPADRQALLDLPHAVRSLDIGSCLVREGEQPKSCAIIVSGFAYRQKVTSAGTRQIVSIHLPGEAVDFQNLYLGTADHNVQMLTRGEVAMISRVDLRDLTRSRPALGEAIFAHTLVEASIFREWVVNVGRRKAPERIAHLLCELGLRLDAMGLAEDYGYELPMTQEELGDAVGLTPVHVNRTLRALTEEGLIERDKRSIKFPDWQKMRDVADFKERYLHLLHVES